MQPFLVSVSLSRKQFFKTNLIKMKFFGLLFISMVLIATSCTKGPGQQITEYRTVGPFNGIEMNGSGKVIILQDSTFEVKVEAGAHLINYISTKVVNGKLIIKEDKNNIVNFKPVIIYVSAQYIDEVILAGSGDISGNNLLATDMFVELSGSGAIYLGVDVATMKTELTGSGTLDIIGTTNYHMADLTGSGELNTRTLISDSTEVELTGSGVARVYADQWLFAELSGSGIIYYYGDPVSKSLIVTGSGSIYQK